MNKESICKSLKAFKEIVMTRYFCFQGRSSQTELWLYLLIYFTVSILLSLIPFIGSLLSVLWGLALLLPNLGICARRLHDRNMSGWLLLLGLIPVIGTIIILILMVPAGSPDSNRFGEAPPPGDFPKPDSRNFQLIMIIAFALATISAIRPFYPRTKCSAQSSCPAAAAAPAGEAAVQPEAAPAQTVQTEKAPAAAKTKAKAKAKVPAFNEFAIYRGLSRKAKDILCYHRRGKFCSDPEFKNCLFAQDGVQVTAGGKIIYNLSSGQLYKNNSSDKKDCLLSVVELKTQKGEVKEAKIFKGFAKARDIEEKREDGDITIVTKYNMTTNGSNIVKLTPVYTIKDGKIYKGDSTNDKDCVLSYHNDLNGGRLLLAVAKFAE